MCGRDGSLQFYVYITMPAGVYCKSMECVLLEMGTDSNICVFAVCGFSNMIVSTSIICLIIDGLRYYMHLIGKYADYKSK